MAFIRAKKRTYRKRPKRWQRTAPEPETHTYYSVVESYRDDQGKVRQRTLAYLGRHATIEKALSTAVLNLLAGQGRWVRKAEEWRRDLARLEVSCPRWEEHKRDWARKELDDLPKRIKRYEARVAELREVAAALGVTDPEALALPGTEAHADIEKSIVAAWGRHQAIAALAG